MQYGKTAGPQPRALTPRNNQNEQSHRIKHILLIYLPPNSPIPFNLPLSTSLDFGDPIQHYIHVNSELKHAKWQNRWAALIVLLLVSPTSSSTPFAHNTPRHPSVALDTPSAPSTPPDCGTSVQHHIHDKSKLKHAKWQKR